jgi:hypothetical protein
MFNIGQTRAAESRPAQSQAGGRHVGRQPQLDASAPHTAQLRADPVGDIADAERDPVGHRRVAAAVPAAVRRDERDGARHRGQFGLTEVLWDVDSQDWNGASTAQIVQAAGRLTNGQVS